MGSVWYRLGPARRGAFTACRRLTVKDEKAGERMRHRLVRRASWLGAAGVLALALSFAGCGSSVTDPAKIPQNADSACDTNSGDQPGGGDSGGDCSSANSVSGIEFGTLDTTTGR